MDSNGDIGCNVQRCGPIDNMACGVRPVICLNPDVKLVDSDVVVGNGENKCFELVE